MKEAFNGEYLIISYTVLSMLRFKDHPSGKLIICWAFYVCRFYILKWNLANKQMVKRSQGDYSGMGISRIWRIQMQNSKFRRFVEIAENQTCRKKIKICRLLLKILQVNLSLITGSSECYKNFRRKLKKEFLLKHVVEKVLFEVCYIFCWMNFTKNEKIILVLTNSSVFFRKSKRTSYSLLKKCIFGWKFESFFRYFI